MNLGSSALASFVLALGLVSADTCDGKIYEATKWSISNGARKVSSGALLKGIDTEWKLKTYERLLAHTEVTYEDDFKFRIYFNLDSTFGAPLTFTVAAFHKKDLVRWYALDVLGGTSVSNCVEDTTSNFNDPDMTFWLQVQGGPF